MSLRQRLAPPARSVIKSLAAAGDVVRPPGPGVTILIYHRVGAGTGGQMDVDPTTFDDQLHWLAATRRVISLDQAASELAGGDAGEQQDAVVLTFDDGTTDWLEHALPALERHGLPATFYVATSFVDEGLPFPSDGRPLDWSALRELASSPLVTIGSHTHRHLLLDRLATTEVEDELDRSVGLIQERLGCASDHFAYPKAVAGSPVADAAVRARFRTAVLAGTRPNVPGIDLYRLHRSPIQSTDGERWFRRKATGGMRLEDDIRQGMNRVRYRNLTS